MSSVLPPVPPRPDLEPGAAASETWRVVSPGRMRATTVVGAGMRLWSGHWLRWGLVTLLFTGVATVVVAAIDPWVGTYGVRWGYGPVPAPDPDPLAVLINVVVALFLAPWLYVVLAKASLEASFEETSRARLIGRTVRGVHSVLWIFFLLVLCAAPFVILVAILVGTTAEASSEAQGVAVSIVIIAFLVLALWIAPRLAILLHVFVGEDLRGTKAIRETWSRSRGAWGTALGVLVLNALIAIGISLVPGVIAAAAFPLPTVEDAVPRAIVSSLVSAVVTPIGVTIGAALYLELSARKALLDQATLRRNLARFDPE